MMSQELKALIKNKKRQPRSWVHDFIVQANGDFVCNQCDQQVSASNSTRRKEHVLKCSKFLAAMQHG
jgi:hypothetical protein